MINKFTFDENKITALYQTSSALWIAFKGSNEECYLHKTDTNDPNNTYYEILIDANEITRIKGDSSYIYCALDSDNYIATRLSQSNPLTMYSYIDKPSGISEDPVDLAIDSSSVLSVLLPGTASATTAKILRYNSSLSLTDTVDLTKSGLEITNAKSMTADTSDNLWLVTYESPAKLIKVDSSTLNFNNKT